jgi:hypothetical protein
MTMAVIVLLLPKKLEVGGLAQRGGRKTEPVIAI